MWIGAFVLRFIYFIGPCNFKLMGTDLMNGRECKIAAYNAIDSIIKVSQTKGFIIFIN